MCKRGIRISASLQRAAGILFLAGFVAGCASSKMPVAAGRIVAPVGADTSLMLKDKWGIEITSLRTSAHGHMIDFRYRVLDPDKAAMLADVRYNPILIDQSTGIQMKVPNTPKLGPLRQSAKRLEAGKIYFMLFANSGLLVKPGSLVTIVIGDFRAADLVVQ